MLRSGWFNAAIAAGVLTSVVALGGCGQFSPAYLKPLSPQTQALLAEKGMTEESPVLVRIFKAESELEVWKAKDDGRFYHFKTYPICDWSGRTWAQGQPRRPAGARGLLSRLVGADEPEEQISPRLQYRLPQRL